MIKINSVRSYSKYQPGNFHDIENYVAIIIVSLSLLISVIIVGVGINFGSIDISLFHTCFDKRSSVKPSMTDFSVPMLVSEENFRDVDDFSVKQIAMLIEKLGDGTSTHQRDSVYGLAPRGLDAVVSLGKIGKPAIPALKNALKNTNALIRGNAALTLGFIKDPSIVEDIAALLSDSDVPVRVKVVMALAEVDHPGATNALIQASADDDAEVRGEAVRALGLRYNPDVKKILYPALDDDDDWYVRSEALSALRVVD